MTQLYDAIVVGARCAGAPTAMLLARQGHRVLLVDRATFPSDTISTHLIHPPGVEALRRWGLLDRVAATGCPPIWTYSFDMGPFTISGAAGPDPAHVAYAPRRTVIDKLLVDAAAEAGAEVREAFVVEEVLTENGRVTGIRGRDRGGSSIAERARVVVGADGFQSLVARAVGAERYHEVPPLEVGYYTYWSDLPIEGFEAYDRPDRAFAAWPTNDGLTLVVLSWPYAELEANRGDVERHYLAAIDRAPRLAERLRAARREEPYRGMFVPGFFRKPFGPGWALVGDASYNKDFITAQGMTDAFLDAEGCAAALHEALSGDGSLEGTMAAHQASRDARALPMYEFTCNFARIQPPPPEMQPFFAALPGNREATNGFVWIITGFTSPAEYFAPENVGRVLASA